MFDLFSSDVENSNQLQQLVFFDANLQDLIIPITNDNIQVYSYHDLDDISQKLTQWKNVDAVHIFSHGADGYLQLGNTSLSSANLDEYTDSLSQWNNSLSANADVLFYGCNVAQTDIGEDFFQQISNITGADIAASHDLTGNAKLGGDWDLEYQLGDIETESLVISSYESVLDTIGENNTTTLTDNETYNSGLDIDGTLIIDGDVTITVKDDFTLSNLGVIKGNDDGLVDSIIIEAGDNNVDISGFIGGNGLTDIRINSDSRIDVNDGATLFTRQISNSDFDSENYEDANSIADSGNIDLKAKRVIIGDEDSTADTGAKLLANVEDSSTFTAGNIDITGIDNPIRLPLIFGFENLLSKVTIDEATLQGQDISIITKTIDRNLGDVAPDFVPEFAFEYLASPALSGLQNKILPVSVQVRGAESFTTINNSNITGQGDISIDSVTEVDASSEAISIDSNALNKIASNVSSSAAGGAQNQVKFAAALGIGTGTAETTLKGTTTITAKGNVSVTSDVENLTKVNGFVVSNLNQISGTEKKDLVRLGSATAVAITNTTSKNTIQDNVTIESDANVIVDANADVTSIATADSQVFIDGTASLGFGVNVDNTTVKSTVDGTIVARGQQTADTSKKISDSSQVVGNTISFNNDHGYTTGDEIVYSASVADNPLGLLEEGATYTVQVIDDKTIALLEPGVLDSIVDLDNSVVSDSATHTFSSSTAVAFDGSSSTVIVDDSINFSEAHGLINGQQVTYYADINSTDEGDVDGLVNQADYFVIYIDETTIKLCRGDTIKVKS